MVAKKENNKVELENAENWFSKMVHYLNTLLEKYMNKYPRYKELKKFMEDEKNLYNEDGSLNENYKRWIKDVEKYTVEHPASELLKEEYKGDKIREALMKGVEEYIGTNEELKKSYEETRFKEGPAFDFEEWIYNHVRESSINEEEADKKFNDLIDMITSETLDLLNRDKILKTFLKDSIKEDGEEQ